MGHLFTGVLEASWPTKTPFRKEIGVIRRHLHEAIARRRIYYRTLNELSQSTNRELAELGISRSDIVRLARESAKQYTPKMEYPR